MQPTRPTIQWVHGIKDRGLKLTKSDSYLQDEGGAGHPTIPSTFCTGEIYINLLVIKEVSSMVKRAYVKDRNLCHT
jgi:hypothetical protein